MKANGTLIRLMVAILACAVVVFGALWALTWNGIETKASKESVQAVNAKVMRAEKEIGALEDCQKEIGERLVRIETNQETILTEIRNR